MHSAPSVVKILAVDYISLLAAAFPAVTWVVYLAVLIFEKNQQGGPSFLPVAVIITLISVLVLVWRIRQFFSIYAEGYTAAAHVSNVWFFRDRGRVEYIFSHQGQKYVSGTAVHKVKAVQDLHPGDEVIVVFDPNNPKQAFIRDLYG